MPISPIARLGALCKMTFSSCAVGILLFGQVCLGSEPACSKYDYEEKLLERMIQVQFDVKQFSLALERMKSEMDAFMKSTTTMFEEEKSKLSSFRDNINHEMTKWSNESAAEMKTLHSVSSEVQTFMKSTTDQLQKQMTQHKENTSIPLVLFRARSPTKVNPTVISTGETIVMGTVEENIGGGYNSQDGKFTAPHQGLYLFTANICGGHMDYLYYVITKDGTNLTGSSIYDKYAYTCHYLSALVYLKNGDKVWLQCTNTGKIRDDYNSYFSTFQGSMIHR